MLRRLVSALARSGELSGNFGSSIVIRLTRSQSSIRVRRKSSLIVSTRIVSSIFFQPRQSRPSGGGPCAGGGGCIACDRNEEEECVSTCSHKGDDRRDMAGRRTGFVWWGWRKPCWYGRVAPKTRVQLCSRITSTSRILTRSEPRAKTALATRQFRAWCTGSSARRFSAGDALQNAIKLRVVSRTTKSVSYLVKTADLASQAAATVILCFFLSCFFVSMFFHLHGVVLE